MVQDPKESEDPEERMSARWKAVGLQKEGESAADSPSGVGPKKTREEAMAWMEELEETSSKECV